MASAFDSMMPPTPEVIQRCNRLLSIPDATDIHGQDTPPPIGRMALLLGQAGLLGLTVSNGGHGLGVLAAVHALETVGRHRPFFVDPLFFGNFSITRVIGDAAESNCRGRYLARLIQGEAILPMAISEPEAGAAAADLTTATSDSDGTLTVTGEKRFVSYVSDAKEVAVAARFGTGVETIGAVIVPTNAPHLELGTSQRFIGGESWSAIKLRSVRVAPTDVVLRGGLFTRWGGLFDCDKLGTSARALGLALHCFDVARLYAAERRQFGRPLCEFQAIQAKFGEMDARLNAARLVLYTAAKAADDGASIGYEAAAAKLLCGEVALRACSEAAQIMGATGVSSLAKVEYCLRKVQGLTITSGTSELLKVKLAETVFGRRFPQATPPV